MHPGQISSHYFKSHQQEYIDLMDHAAFDVNEEGNFVFSPIKTYEKISSLDEQARKTAYHNLLLTLQQEKNVRVQELKTTIEKQGEKFSEKAIKEMHDYISLNILDEKSPFDKFPTFTEEEKARRKTLQENALNVYLEKECEEVACHDFIELCCPTDLE
ncbi:MAG: hypothetical protein MJ072_05110, partial [Clostridia bacterium]|nr:hypothetical protein [Clostridia bacterium]